MQNTSATFFSLLSDLTDMKLFCQMAVKVSKHLLWLSGLILPWTDNKQFVGSTCQWTMVWLSQAGNEYRGRRSSGPPTLSLSKMWREEGNYQTVVPRIQMKKVFPEK